MEEFRIIFYSFISAAIFLTLAMLWYDLKWKKKNPWWRQNDCKMRLSPAEQNYRQSERQKLNNALMMWFVMLFVILGTMVLVLSANVGGGLTRIDSYWFYLVPFIGAVLLALSSIQRRK